MHFVFMNLNDNYMLIFEKFYVSMEIFVDIGDI